MLHLKLQRIGDVQVREQLFVHVGLILQAIQHLLLIVII